MMEARPVRTVVGMQNREEIDPGTKKIDPGDAGMKNAGSETLYTWCPQKWRNKNF